MSKPVQVDDEPLEVLERIAGGHGETPEQLVSEVLRQLQRSRVIAATGPNTSPEAAQEQDGLAAFARYMQDPNKRLMLIVHADGHTMDATDVLTSLLSLLKESQLSEAQLAVIEEVVNELRWKQAFADPRSARLLEQLGSEALAEDEAGLTHDLDDSL